MYAYISGTLAEKRPTLAILEVQGIGYRLHVPTSTYERLPEPGMPVKLYVHQHVREDLLQLYGFASESERNLFQVMLGVSGIGPKLALAALSAMPPAELRARVVNGETAMLTNIPGVGRKTAERLILELRDRFAEMEPAEATASYLEGEHARLRQAHEDALAALESLGFSRAAAENGLRRVMRTHPDVQAAEDLVRLALREK